jgi:ATP-dependent Lon protease
MENSKPNTRSHTKNKKPDNDNICKINNNNDDDFDDVNSDDEKSDLNNIIDDKEDLANETFYKRKFEDIFSNNTIIIINNNKDSEDPSNINDFFSNTQFENLEENIDDDDINEKINDPDYKEDTNIKEYHNLHNNIIKNKKYIRQNPNFINYNNKEANYFLNLNANNKYIINQFEKKTIELNKDEIPIRFRIINSNLDDGLKAIALKKLNNLSSMNEKSGEYFKILNYIENLCKIPCGIYKKLIIPENKNEVSKFLLNSYNILNKNVYGHNKSKEQIIRIIGQWISNPELKGNVIGIHGSPGCGKTRLIKEGLCKALNLPFVFIPLGGINDSAYLTGHSFTYEGAIHGKIVDSLIKAECMNPIIYFDELDKVSDSSRGEEIINTLIHMTDSTQNDMFYDKYFYDIPLNLSKALIIFTYNDDKQINRILRDRMIRINTDIYNNKDKIEIAKEFLIPELLKDFNFTKEELIFENDIINYIITKCEKEEGVRNLRRAIECIISNINLFKLLNKNSKSSTDTEKNNNETNDLSINNLKIDYKTPFKINTKIVDYLVKKNYNNDSLTHLYT